MRRFQGNSTELTLYTFGFSPFEDLVLFPLLWILHLKFGVKRALLKNFGGGYV